MKLSVRICEQTRELEVTLDGDRGLYTAAFTNCMFTPGHGGSIEGAVRDAVRQFKLGDGRGGPTQGLPPDRFRDHPGGGWGFPFGTPVVFP